MYVKCLNLVPNHSSVTDGLNHRRREPILKSLSLWLSAMSSRIQERKMHNGDRVRSIVNSVASALNPIPPKSFFVPRRRGTVLDVEVANVLDRISRKTAVCINSSLSKDVRRILIQGLMKKKLEGGGLVQRRAGASESIAKRRSATTE